MDTTITTPAQATVDGQILTTPTAAPTIPDKAPPGPGVTFDQRMETLRRLNASAGYAVMPGTIVPEGTALIPYGEQRLRALRAEIGALPTAREGLPAAAAAYRALEPVDVRDRLSSLRMGSDGKIFRVFPDGRKGPAIGYSHTGLAQCVSLYADGLGIPRGMVGALEWLQPEARAAAFNDLAVRADSLTRATPDRVFRTIRNPGGGRYLRAVTSSHHVGAAGNTAAVLAAAFAVCERAGWLDSARVRTTIVHDRTDLELFLPMYQREIRVGDVALGRLRVTISETKDVAASVLDGLLRVLCLNFTTAWYGKGESFSRRHVGDGRSFLREIGGAMVSGAERLGPFFAAFGAAAENPIPGSRTRADVLDAAGKAWKGLLPAETPDLARALWDADGARSQGDTLGGLVQAMTRASQGMALDDADAVEREAGRLTVEGWGALGIA